MEKLKRHTKAWYLRRGEKMLVTITNTKRLDFLKGDVI